MDSARHVIGCNLSQGTMVNKERWLNDAASISARHVIRCNLTQGTMVDKERWLNDAASTMHQSVHSGLW